MLAVARPGRDPAPGQRDIFSMRIVSIGEVLWDVFEHSEQLGGAPFNFAVNASRLGHEVIFVSAVGEDERGRAVLARARQAGLGAEFIQIVPGAPTGTVSVRVDSAGQPDFTIHRPAAYDALDLDGAALERLQALEPDWLYYGSLHQADPRGRAQTRKLIDRLAGARRFYDVNLRRNSYTPELVLELMASAHVVKLNDEEALTIESFSGRQHEPLAEFTESWSRRLGWTAVAVTRGARGCGLRIGQDYAEPAGYVVTVADTVGAGDAFAAALLHGLAQGWDARRTGDFANRLGAVVAARPGALPPWSMDDCWRLKN